MYKYKLTHYNVSSETEHFISNRFSILFITPMFLADFFTQIGAHNFHSKYQLKK